MANSYKPILSELGQSYLKHADPEKAIAMKAYLRDQFDMFGIPKPLRKELDKPIFKKLLTLETQDLSAIAEDLYAREQREFHYFCILYLEKAIKSWKKEDLKLFESLVVRHSWWDTVDFIADHLIGKHLLKFPELIPSAISRYNASSNMWLNRTAILFQLKYKEKTDVALLFDICKQHAHSKEFFIQKAIGWALREYHYTDPKAVKAFCNKTALAPLSLREALKHAV